MARKRAEVNLSASGSTVHPPSIQTGAHNTLQGLLASLKQSIPNPNSQLQPQSQPEPESTTIDFDAFNMEWEEESPRSPNPLPPEFVDSLEDYLREGDGLDNGNSDDKESGDISDDESSPNDQDFGL